MQRLHLCGEPVSDEAAFELVALLDDDGSDEALAAAEMVWKGVERGLVMVGLTPVMRDAMLAVLDDPPAGLCQLRGALARDHRERCGRPHAAIRP